MKCKRCGWEIEPMPGEDNWYLTDKACDESPAEIGLWTCDIDLGFNIKPEDRHLPDYEVDRVEAILAKYEF